MKICFFGNQGNKNYRQCLCFRNRGYDARLILFEAREGKRSDPQKVDPSLTHGYPEWIVAVQSKPDPAFFRWVEEEFDIIVVAGNRAAHYASNIDPEKVPIILAPTGPGNIGAQNTPADKAQNKFTTLHNAEAVLTAQPFIARKLQELGMIGKTRFQSPIFDVAMIENAVDRAFLNKLQKTYEPYRIVFSWFSRNLMNPKTMSYKAPERFIQAARKFVDSRPDSSVRIVYGCHGPDAEEARSLIERLKLHPWTDIVGHQDYGRLLAYLSLPNMVLFDNLAMRSLTSGISRDALSVGSVVVRHINPEEIAIAYGPDCPIIDASDIDQCCSAMNRLYDMSQERFEDLQVSNKKWAVRYLNWPAHIDRYAQLMQNILLVRKLAERGRVLKETYGNQG